MKYSESWLHEWVKTSLTREKLADALTMSGLEVEEIIPASELPNPDDAPDINPKSAKNNDYVFDVGITPNRGDCLSIRGLAREIAAITNSSFNHIQLKPISQVVNDVFPVTISAKKACPRYVGRVIRGVKADLASPDWLKEKLRLSQVRSISPIVDVANYVMLELGQPMHAFDLNTLNKSIQVRMSKSGEKIALLDGSEKTLDDATLVIADDKRPLAIAGVMGGLDSSVTTLTTDIFLESAYFSPEAIARQRQYYQLNSDSSYRFERGIDFTIQREAIERATQLIVEIAGGQPGPVIEVQSEVDLPKTSTITLTQEKLSSVLGIKLPEDKIKAILNLLQFNIIEATKTGWKIQIPPYRHDITIPEDIIEEIARIYGYDNIPTHTITAPLMFHSYNAESELLNRIKLALCDQDFYEVISYSFVDPQLQQLLDPAQQALSLVNPISADMAVMRTNLWPGLVNTMRYNRSHQQPRIRLFETGLCYNTNAKGELTQILKIGGLITGLAMPEQWGYPSREADFFDLKGHIENLLALTLQPADNSYQHASHPALHPGQSANIFYQQQQIGVIGTLHPSIIKALDLTKNTKSVHVFELDVASLLKTEPHQYREFSKFPEIRRDIALLVNETVPVATIQVTIKRIAGDWLKDIFIFDVYQGKGISPGLKSVAAGLVLQHPTRTLVDDEVNALMDKLTTALKEQLGAELRR